MHKCPQEQLLEYREVNAGLAWMKLNTTTSFFLPLTDKRGHKTNRKLPKNYLERWVTTTSINAARVKIVIIVKLGFVKIGVQRTERKWTRLSFSQDTWEQDTLQSLKGRTAGSWLTWRWAENPAQEDLPPGCRGPHSAAFPAPPLCLPSPDTTYHSSALGIHGLPHH